MIRSRHHALTMLAGLAGLAALAVPAPAHAQGVFEVCKGESKTVVSGSGRPWIAVVYPADFPVTTTPAMRNAVGEVIARAEHARIVAAKDVEAAKQLVDQKRWTERSDACGYAPSMVAVLGQTHPNLSTAQAQVACDGATCQLIVDVERHGRPGAQRFERYAAPLAGDKTKLATIQAAAHHLAPQGPPPDAPKAGLAQAELAPGIVTTRSDADGALELDRIMEADPAFAACAPKHRHPHDVRGYWAKWKLSARGTAMEVEVKPFGGADPADQEAADCLRRELQHMQLACPRDGKVVDVKTAICL